MHNKNVGLNILLL